MAQSIGRAFHKAYMQFLKANGIDDNQLQAVQQQHQASSGIDYQDVLSQQQISPDELSLFANKQLQKEVRALPVYLLNSAGFFPPRCTFTSLLAS